MRRTSILYLELISVLLAMAFLLLPGVVRAQSPESVQYVFPMPGARFVSPGTTIAIRPGEVLNPASINNALFNVVGSVSGTHPGSAILANDRHTVIFRPAQPFSLGENVRVVIAGGIRTTSGQTINSVTFSFTISPQPIANPPEDTLLAPDERYIAPRAPQSNLAPHTPQLLTVPSTFPPMTITVPANGTGDGYLFMSPFPGVVPTDLYLIILDNSGQPVYYNKQANTVQDFKKQPNGSLSYYMNKKFYVMDNTYTVTDTFQGGNGYTLDMHDFQVLPNGDALFLIYDSQKIDMSTIVAGGVPTATVTGCIIQEQDPSKNVVFQWSSWDHFLITDTYASLTGSNVDYVHCNAIELDQDGNLLLSSRHFNEITKIDHNSGDIIWRWGGKNNQFTFQRIYPPLIFLINMTSGDCPTETSPCSITEIFALHPALLPRSEYQMDEVNKVVTETWQFRNTPDTYGFATGNVQRLPNGNTVIDWGYGALVTEVKPDNSKAFEISLTPRISYRAFRFPWHGYPTTQPTLIAQNQISLTVLTASWNGATDIASYRVYKGNAPQPTTPITTQAKTGFETTINLPCDPFGIRYYRVMPVDLNAQDTTFSNDVTVNACLQYFFPLISR